MSESSLMNADLVVLPAENGYSPVTHDEFYKEIFK